MSRCHRTEIGLNKLYLGATREAAEWFRRADAVAPRDPERWTWLQYQVIDLYGLEVKDALLDEAETLILDAAARAPEHQIMLKARGLLLRARGRFAEAITASETDPRQGYMHHRVDAVGIVLERPPKQINRLGSLFLPRAGSTLASRNHRKFAGVVGSMLLSAEAGRPVFGPPIAKSGRAKT